MEPPESSNDVSTSWWVPAFGIAVVALGVLIGLGVSEHQSSATFWVGVGAVCSGVAAIATATLAYFTLQMATKTAAEASATVSLAEEAKTDRKLQWQPVVQASVYAVSSGANVAPATQASVQNNGGGPALSVRVLYRLDPSKYLVFRFGDLSAAGGQEEDLDFAHSGTPLNRAFDGHPDCQTGEIVIVAALCSDILARRFRFAYATFPGTMSPLRRLSAEIDEAPFRHGWSTDPLIWDQP